MDRTDNSRSHSKARYSSSHATKRTWHSKTAVVQQRLWKAVSSWPTFGTSPQAVDASHGSILTQRIHSMVFLIRQQDQSKANAASFEVPFRGLWEERFNQPIFGCNNLTASIQYYDEQPFVGNLTMRIDFVEGGVNTFLPMFNNVLRTTRVQLAHESANQQAPPAPVSLAPSAPPVESFLPGHNQAFVDPHDPSRIFTTQPFVEEQQRRDRVPEWAVSAPGMRRR